MNKKWLCLIDIGYWGIIIYTMFSGVIKDVNTEEINKAINSVITGGFSANEILRVSFIVIGILFLLFIFSIIANIEITAIYFGIKIAIKKHKKDKLEKIDFKNDGYYKEKIPEYSPAVLSYVDDFTLDKKDIVATLLSLELKKKIKIKDKLEVIDDTYDGLTDNEKYIFKKAKNNDLKNVNMEEFKQVVAKEAKDKGLIEEKSVVKSRVDRLLWSSVGISVALMVIVFAFLNNYIMLINNDTAIIICFVCVFIIITCAMVVPCAVIAYISHYSILRTIDPYIRSKQGKEINIRLEGLKKYIKEFSTLDEKTKEYLTLWEEFLIYSVMFGTNDKIIDEVDAKIN